jgi:hypothetical protein
MNEVVFKRTVATGVGIQATNRDVVWVRSNADNGPISSRIASVIQ